MQNIDELLVFIHNNCQIFRNSHHPIVLNIAGELTHKFFDMLIFGHVQLLPHLYFLIDYALKICLLILQDGLVLVLLLLNLIFKIFYYFLLVVEWNI